MRVVVLALIAVSCERAEPPSPVPPRPRDDAAIDCVAVPDRDARVAALDRLHAHFIARRERSVTEAPDAFTKAYVGFELAYDYARLGRAQTARDLLTSGRAALDTNDPIHGYLVAAYSARIEQALRCQPPGAPLGDALDARLGGLSRLDRYKVDRLRETSRVLTTAHIGAIDEFARRRGGTTERDALEIGAEAERARAIAERLDAVAAHPDDHRCELGEVLDAIRRLPAPGAKPLVARAIAAVRAQPICFRFYGQALQLAASFDRAALPSLMEAIRQLAPAATASDLAPVLADSLRALREDTASLRTLWGGLSEPADPAAIAYAAGLLRLGDRARAQPILERAHIALGGLVPGARFEALRLLGLAYSVAPTDVAIAGVDQLAALIEHQSDTYGTNTHFALTVVATVSILGAAVVGE